MGHCSECQVKKLGNGQAKPALQLQLFEPAPTQICDRVEKLLQSRLIEKMQQRCVEALLDIQARHKRVVFIAGRVPPLEFYATRLVEQGCHDQVYVITSKEEPKGETPYKHYKRGKDIEPLFSETGERRVTGSASVFMTYQMVEGVNMQRCDALVCISVASSVVQLVQGLGRIDRVNAPEDVIHYYLADIPTPDLTSDGNVGLRIEQGRALTARKAPAVRRKTQDAAEHNFYKAIGFIRAPRELRDNHYGDVLKRIRKALSDAVYRKVERDVGESDMGIWGAELGILPGGGDTTIFHLRGAVGDRIKRRPASPPRLLAVTPGGGKRNQIGCARLLEDAYIRTKETGLHIAPGRVDVQKKAIRQVRRHLPELKEYDLRPERILAPLETLAWAINPNERPRGLFEELSLQALEALTDTWTRALDPYWKREKARVSATIKSGPSYTTCRQVAARALEDVDGPKLRAEMEALYSKLRTENPQDTGLVRSRISVVYVLI